VANTTTQRARPFRADPSRPRLRLWPSLSPAVYLRAPEARLPFPLDHPTATLYERGRHALWDGVRALGLSAGDEVLTPAYHCGSEVEALASAGLVCRFYEATETLEPDPAELESLVGRRTRALLVIHYFGFPQDVGRWRAWCDERELFLIEDCAHAAFASSRGRPLGSVGDLAIFILYKTVPLPDGGVAVGARSPSNGGHGRLALAPLAKRHARWLMSRSAALDGLLSGLERPYEGDFALGSVRGASAATRALLRRTARPSAAATRRGNYRLLLDRFADRVPMPFATLPAGASPLFFPVATNGEPGLAERLDRAGIEARPFWPVLHRLLPVESFPGARAWHERFVALPVHQELRATDIDRILHTLAAN
jgi:dTDP-4-amino-4,6-dideoxygalactose transaminase